MADSFFNMPIKTMPEFHMELMEQLWESNTNDYAKITLDDGFRVMQDKRNYNVYMIGYPAPLRKLA